MWTGSHNRIFFLSSRTVIVALVGYLVFFDARYFLQYGPQFIFSTKTAAAAEAAIASPADNAASQLQMAGSATVFTDDQTGYKFFKASANTCQYSKTTDGGVTWGAGVVFDNLTDCGTVVVWYDQWTPGDTGSNIHMVALHPNGAREDLRYNRLDTSSDTLLGGATAIDISTAFTNTFGAGANKPAITKGTDGTVYVAISDSPRSFVVECSSLCNLTTSWTETGTNPLDNIDADYNLLAPLPSGDILLINRDRSTNDLRSKEWNGTSWDASWNVLDANAAENATFDVGMSAVVNPNNDDVYLAYVADFNNFSTADHDIRTAIYNGTSWSRTTDITTNDTRGLTNVTVGIDLNTDDVYVGYSARGTLATANTAEVYWASSTDAMTVWGSEQGPVNVGADDMYALDLNYVSNQRLFLSWYEATTDDIRGDTILDTSPSLTVSSIGSQQSVVRASTSDFYVGGAFVLEEFEGTRNVTDITITESGSVDGNADLDNIELYYDLDTSAPYDCNSESYGGSEAQFGVTDTNGFSGANGVSSFTGSVSISLTQSMCVYVVLDVLNSAADGQTLDISIDDPSTDVQVTGGVTPKPDSEVALFDDTDIENSRTVQEHYHWRNDDGVETLATSATGGEEDTIINSLNRGTPVRLRLSAYNDGSTSTLPTTFRLEYGVAAPTCAAISSWTDVDAADDAWNMSDSAFVVNGTDTTNIATSSGGVSDPDNDFLTLNGGQRDTTSETGALTLSDTNFVELEYSIVASTSASAGNTYCFRLTDEGTPLDAYTIYPEATVAADVTVSTIGTQVVSAEIPESNVYSGGAFVLTEAGGGRNITDLIITESGSINANTALENIRLYYDTDTSAPYDCNSESYAPSDTRFGATSTSFSAADGTASFSGTIPITTTQTACVYVVYDVNTNAQNGNTIDLSINNPSTEVTVSTGSVAPSTPIAIASSTETSGAIVTQVHYHWRNDDGTEAGATSATGGVEDTPVTDFSKNTTVRLRIGLSNEGGTSSIPHRYGLEFGIKATTCDTIVTWTDIEAVDNDSWDLFDSTFITHGNDTTDIATTTGGVSDEEAVFLTPNEGIRETDSFTATTTLASNEYVDFEYAITSTSNTPYETSYCLRLTEDGEPLVAYDNYAEVTTTVKRDFKIQRGTSSISGTSQAYTAGVDYEAPASSSVAFVRITNTFQTGAGRTTSGNQNPDDYSAYITGASDLTSGFTISRDTDSGANTRVSWEIIEFIGDIGTDNEIKVRDVGTVAMGTGVTSTVGSIVSGVADDSDIVVFITGTRQENGGRSSSSAMLATANWASSTAQPTFERIANSNPIDISYAVVEFTGLNWKIQRIEHTYTAAGVTETEPIEALSSPNKAFLETQKRMKEKRQLASFGHQVYISSMGVVSFALDASAGEPTEHVSVAWVIENTQNGSGAMKVFRSNGLTAGGAEPLTVLATFDGTGVNGTDNASIFGLATQNQTGNNTPRQIAGLFLRSTTTYEVWRSDTGGTLNYRTEVVQWPAADLAVRQNYYHFYVNTNALTPTDSWPVGTSTVGENASITALDDPISDGEQIRIRNTFKITNGTLAADLLTLKLQYGLRSTTCSAIGTWTDVGASGSGVIWRAYDNGGVADGTALSGNPPTGGDLLISVADRAGRYTESYPTTGNPFSVNAEEDVEYDWVIEHNGALQRSNYCFRAVRSDGSELEEYLYYPQLRTEGYAPVQKSWRWYDDETNETPTTALAAEDTAPVEVAKDNIIKLRVTIDEVNNLDQTNARFKLQFSDQADFGTVQDVAASTTCMTADIWCYADGAGLDNATITTAVLSTSDACAGGVGDGCGVHNEAGDSATGFTHRALRAIENEFTIEYQPVSGYYGQVWYFRLFDIANGEVVVLNSGATHPSLVGESGSLSFTIDGVDGGTTTEGIVTDITTTATSVPFGTLSVNTEYEAAHRLTVDTNATAGYRVLKYARQALISGDGDAIAGISGTNNAPVTWAVGCLPSVSCFGYHAGDDALAGGSTRFAADDSYAAFATTSQEVMYSGVPTVDTEDIIYKLKIDGTQAAGDYTTEVVYIAVPVF